MHILFDLFWARQESMIGFSVAHLMIATMKAKKPAKFKADLEEEIILTDVEYTNCVKKIIFFSFFIVT